MKKIYLLSLIFVFIAFTGFGQNVLLVDNTPTAPTGAHVYNNLQTAINATVPGDIIHVKPSGTNYGNITITGANDSISIFGIGINPDKEIGQKSLVSTVYISGNNIRISGLVTTGTVYCGYNGTAGNIIFDNNRYDNYLYVAFNSVTSNVVVRNCWFRDYAYFRADANATIVTNCIFSFTTTNQVYECYNGTLISHCLFFGNGTTDNAFYNMANSTVSNCIFYGKEPNISLTNSNNTFNNCLAIYATDTVQNAGSVNNPVTSLSGNVFASTDIVLQDHWNMNWDPTLDPASVELVGGGDNGTDIGITGGTIPWSITSAPLPYIKSFVVPSVIKQGDNLGVSVKAKGN